MEKEFLIKVHKSYRLVIAICDKELYGQKFEEDNKQLDLTSEFFNGKEISKNEILSEIQFYQYEDATFNIIGKKSTELFKELNLINQEGILKIQNIPFALVLL